MVLRSFLCAFLACALAACATTPRSAGSRRAEVSLPSNFNGDLYLCVADIGNAPPADASGRLEYFSPFAFVRGIELAVAPVEACLSSGWGPRGGDFNRFHNGIDLKTRGEAPVFAAGDGVIVRVGSLSGYGEQILIAHGDGVETRYAHLSSYARGVREGRRVRQGNLLGRSGDTGNATAIHLHYEVLIDGRSVNPLTLQPCGACGGRIAP